MMNLTKTTQTIATGMAIAVTSCEQLKPAVLRRRNSIIDVTREVVRDESLKAIGYLDLVSRVQTNQDLFQTKLNHLGLGFDKDQIWLGNKTLDKVSFDTGVFVQKAQPKMQRLIKLTQDITNCTIEYKVICQRKNIPFRQSTSPDEKNSNLISVLSEGSESDFDLQMQHVDDADLTRVMNEKLDSIQEFYGVIEEVSATAGMSDMMTELFWDHELNADGVSVHDCLSKIFGFYEESKIFSKRYEEYEKEYENMISLSTQFRKETKQDFIEYIKSQVSQKCITKTQATNLQVMSWTWTNQDRYSKTVKDKVHELHGTRMVTDESFDFDGF